MSSLTGFPLLLQQFKALVNKNLLLAWRNKTSTFLQLLSPLFFIFLIFCFQKAYDAQTQSSTAYRSVTDPQPLVSQPIPPYEDKFSIKTPCFDFVWSGDQNPRIRSVVDAIMANNPGRPIPATKVSQN